VVSLATQEDVESAFGRDLTSDEEGRVRFVLEKLSEMFRRESGQQFTAGTSTVRLKVNGGRVYLAQYPVVSVTAVVDDDADDVEYTRLGQWLSVDLPSDRFVTVTYSHGGDVPDEVWMAVADAARQVLSIDTNAVVGRTQTTETAGPFSQSSTYATWALGGAPRLSPEDITLARSYRTKVPTVWVQSA
jgi:hypothetical protein